MGVRAVVTVIWVAVLVVAGVLAGVICWFASRRAPQREVTALRQALESARAEASRLGNHAGKVLDALIEFLCDFEEINTHIERADKAFKAAKNRLSESSQSVISRSRRLVEAGAKGRKVIPEELQSVSVAQVLSLTSDAATTPDDAPA